MELYLLVVPNDMKKEILYEMHDALSGAHTECAKVKTDTTKPKEFLQPWTTIEKTFQRIGIDTLVNQNLERMSEKSKKRFDKNRQQIDFSPGDLVYLRKPNRKVGTE
uniref:Uncharacterized protein n=1 Tax=Strigamia maritima TaxID=126957 RepID=T1JAE5_STRMM